MLFEKVPFHMTAYCFIVVQVTASTISPINVSVLRRSDELNISSVKFSVLFCSRRFTSEA